MKTNTLVMAIVVLAMMAVAVLPVGAQSAGPDFQVTLNPSDGQSVGNSVNIHIKVNSPNPGATRINIPCGSLSKGESAEVEFDSNWNTSGCGSGNQQIIIQTKSPDDPNWTNPNTKYFSYVLTGSQQPPTPVPPSTPPMGPNISIFDFSPSSANVGDQVTIHIKVDSANPGATKLTVSCGSLIKNETSEVEFYTTWNTNGCPAGTATVNVLSRDVNDPNWANPSSATRSYGLSAPPVPVPSPTANFWADATSILQGQCTNLHWDTADAVSVDIDGSGVNASGDKQVCPSVTQKFTLTAHAGSGGDNAYRSITITVTASPQPPAVVDSFQTGNVISIGGNIYVIVDGRRRHVPNPATMDALGIGQNLINNKGFNDSQLSQIIQGPDIPDNNIDPQGVTSFREAYLHTTSIVPKPTQAPTPVPQVVQPTLKPPVQPTAQSSIQPQGGIPNQPGSDQTTSQSSGLPSSASCQPAENKTWLEKFFGVATADASCTDFVSRASQAIRDCWGNSFPNAGLWDDWARDPKRSGSCGWSVEPANNNGLSNAKPGDIIVWNGFNQNNGQSCSGADAPGHVAIFIGKNGDSTINVNGSGWNGDQSHTKVNSNCMSVIHLNLKPNQTSNTANTCSQYIWPFSVFCKWGWIK